MSALAAIGGATALASAIGGGIASAAYNKKARKLLGNQIKENDAWYNIKRTQDYTQRSDVQAAINEQRKMLQEQAKRNRATNAVAGGTDESLALEKEAANNAMAQTMSDVAAASAAKHDAEEAQYKARKDALEQQQIQNYQQQAAQVAQAAGQAVGAGVNVVGNELGTVANNFGPGDAANSLEQLKKTPK